MSIDKRSRSCEVQFSGQPVPPTGCNNSRQRQRSFTDPWATRSQLLHDRKDDQEEMSDSGVNRFLW